MEKRLLLLTGSPGVGKTSVLLRIVESLRTKGYNVGGMVSREVRVDRERVGFEILDLKTNRRGWLAHVVQQQGPEVGRYKVNIGDLESIGVAAINDAVRGFEVVVVDEIGPMEFHSAKFKQAVREAVQSPKLMVCVVHWKAADSLLAEIRGRPDAEVYVVTRENRESLPAQVAKQALVFLSGTA